MVTPENYDIISYIYYATLPGFVVAAAEVPFLPIDADVLASVGAGPRTGGLELLGLLLSLAPVLLLCYLPAQSLIN